MPPKKIALISDAWDPQVNGVVTTFKNIIPLLNLNNLNTISVILHILSVLMALYYGFTGAVVSW